MSIIDSYKIALLKTLPTRYVIKSLRNIFYPLPLTAKLVKTAVIEVSSICNARCIFCAYRFGYRNKQIMAVDDFGRIAKSLVHMGYENLDLTSLSGELFTHPNAIEIIKTAYNAGFKHIEAFTNAILIKRFNAEDLLKSGIKALLISFPGFGREYYRDIFGIDAYEDFKHSVIQLLNAHKKLSSKVCITFEPRTFLSEKQIKKSSFYVNHLSKFLNEFIVTREPIRVFDTWGGEISATDLIKGMKTDMNPIKSISPLKKTFLCNRIILFGIQVNGDIRLCNCRYDKTIETDQDALFIDNINNYLSLDDLLIKNKNKIATIWNDFSRGKLPAMCKKCPFYIPVRISNHSSLQIPLLSRI